MSPALVSGADDQWKEAVKAMETPKELLEALVDLDKAVCGVGDPYYRDLYQTIIDRAEELVRR